MLTKHTTTQYLAFIVYLFMGTAAQAIGLLDSHLEKGQRAPIREGEKPTIPMGTGDPTLDTWKKMRDFTLDPRREPGPTNIQKYNFGMSWFGIPTFFHLPVALRPEDLAAG